MHFFSTFTHNPGGRPLFHMLKLVNTPYQLMFLQTKTDLKDHLKKLSSRPYQQQLADLHLLLWLCKQPNLEQSDMLALCEAVKNQTPVAEGYQCIIESIAGV